ncbi:hypothetical protein [Moorena bouillonii]|uniref:hypothetical protein n=1 Tax=Moorena bouillonii TaxID=207920 RepID=UPI00117DFC75|nr:hypothetical protein [Moorena bouillonii]
MPTLHYCGLVGIAYFIARRSIMILISNAHPTIRLPIINKRCAIDLWSRYAMKRSFRACAIAFFYSP